MKVLTIKVVLTAFSLLLTFQAENARTIYVESWKASGQVIKEQQLKITLTPKQSTYKTTILNASGKEKYELVIRHNPVQYGSSESWSVLLYERPKHQNLLQPYKPGDVGDYIRAEDSPGWLYRWEGQSLPRDFVYLPFLAKRVVKVGRSYCVIQIDDYKLSASNPKLFDSLTVKVEFTNRFDPAWKAAT